MRGSGGAGSLTREQTTQDAADVAEGFSHKPTGRCLYLKRTVYAPNEEALPEQMDALRKVRGTLLAGSTWMVTSSRPQGSGNSPHSGAWYGRRDVRPAQPRHRAPGGAFRTPV